MTEPTAQETVPSLPTPVDQVVALLFQADPAGAASILLAAAVCAGARLLLPGEPSHVEVLDRALLLQPVTGHEQLAGALSAVLAPGARPGQRERARLFEREAAGWAGEPDPRNAVTGRACRLAALLPGGLQAGLPRPWHELDRLDLVIVAAGGCSARTAWPAWRRAVVDRLGSA